ncbi:hypothetical protein IAU60_004751 [Kwoniella sp. DSM 27419]
MVNANGHTNGHVNGTTNGHAVETNGHGGGKLNGRVNGGMNGTANGHHKMNGHSQSAQSDIIQRPHPQTSCVETAIDPSSFYGKLRHLYSNQVLKTQLEQMKKQGSYDAFKLQWHPAYDVRRLTEAKTRIDGIPPSLFWESDVGKWIEGACYFLASPDAKDCAHAAEFEKSIQELVDMIEQAQQPDGYLDIYFTLVDPAGKFKNLRDMHEMWHPELELAVLRLYSVTQDPKHLEFGKYLLSARGVQREDQNGKSYFVYEAECRHDEVIPHTMDSYNQSHAPIHEQDAILGHSVRAFYLYTAAADLGGAFLEDAKRLWSDAVDNKMYATGGLGTEPRVSFSPVPHRLPQSTDEGGCYAETCASIACIMTSERILSHGLDGKVRDVMELCLLNAVLGGGSLNGQQFSYANKQATYGDETATRADWFEGE